MNANVGNIDRAIRILLGLGLAGRHSPGDRHFQILSRVWGVWHTYLCGRGAAQIFTASSSVIEALLHSDASWSTASPFGDVHAATAIQALVDTQLPTRKSGPASARHRMISAADVDDLAIITRTGELCSYRIKVDCIPSPTVLSRLARTIF